VFNEGRYESTADLDDYEALKDEAREIKEDAIERLPELIDEVTEAIEDNGGTVYIADDAADANRYISDVVDGRNVVKSKSMTSEELEVNDALEASGADVWGDRPRRVRLADRRRGTLAHCRSGHSQVPRGDRGPVQRGVRAGRAARNRRGTDAIRPWVPRREDSRR